MKQKENGFTLVDTLLAMVLVMTGTAAVIQLASESNRSWHAHRERLIAHELISHLEHLPFAALARWGERGFDALGRPASTARRWKYRLSVVCEEDVYWLRYRCVLTYTDADGRDVTLQLLRKEWIPDA